MKIYIKYKFLHAFSFKLFSYLLYSLTIKCSSRGDYYINKRVHNFKTHKANYWDWHSQNQMYFVLIANLQICNLCIKVKWAGWGQ